ncbi:hypothetical protein E2C01_020824 [Portunus trituberculatus]|uniref:Uncharacterized protein n=1 Tax=Portunus trituberculatus TaxID=210409 RepID=A0A5B7E1L6_PORTR|nr:hypothetical protein [Portunus trituberculatus]
MLFKVLGKDHLRSHLQCMVLARAHTQSSLKPLLTFSAVSSFLSSSLVSSSSWIIKVQLLSPSKLSSLTTAAATSSPGTSFTVGGLETLQVSKIPLLRVVLPPFLAVYSGSCRLLVATVLDHSHPSWRSMSELGTLAMLPSHPCYLAALAPCWKDPQSELMVMLHNIQPPQSSTEGPRPHH